MKVITTYMILLAIVEFVYIIYFNYYQREMKILTNNG